MYIQIQDHNEQFHVTCADFDCQPQQPKDRNVVIDMKKSNLILLFSQHKTQGLDYFNSSHEQQKHTNLHF